MEQRNAKNKVRTANAVFLLLTAAAAVNALLPGSGFNAPLSPGEAKTLLFSHNYFTITFLKSLYDNSQPLYYLLAHFVSFIPGGVMPLRIFSFALFLGTIITAFNAFKVRKGDNGTTHHINATLLLVGPAPLLLQASTKAEPFALAAFLIAASCLYFHSAFFEKEKSETKFVAAMTLALYTSLAAAAFYAALLPIARNATSAEGKKHTPAAFKRIFIYFIPGLIFRLLGSIKNDTFYDSVLVRGNSLAAFFLHRAAAEFTALFSPANLAVSTLIILVIPLFIFFILNARYSKPNKRNPLLIPLIVAGVVFFFATYKATAEKARADAGAAKLISAINSEENKNAGFLFIDNCGGDNRRLFEYEFGRLNNPHLIISPKNMRPRPLNLGPSFRDFEAKPGGASYMADIKELFLESDKVLLFSDNCKPAQGIKKDFINWSANITNKTQAGKNKYFNIEKLELKNSYSKDGILLDLFVNDCSETEKAARLIQDATFTPLMLEGYFHTRDAKRVRAAEKKLLSACGNDIKCKKTVADKITSFRSGDNTGKR